MNPSVWGTLLLLPFFHAHPGWHEMIEHYYHPAYLSQARGPIHAFASTKAPWPVKLLSIGNSTASYQDYGGSPYFHKGLDMRSDAGNDVRASVGGKILDIENYYPGDPAYWEIAIQDDNGYIWQYHHVERSSIPDDVMSAYRSGTPIAAGTKLGEVYYWGVVSEGERYHHIHVNVAGEHETWLTAFNFLEPLDDKSAPEFVDVFLVQDGDRVDGHSVSGKYTIAAHVRDLVLSRKFYLPPHELTMSIDNGTPQTVWRFDTLPGGSSDTDYVDTLYVRNLVCGDYECRRPIIDLGFNKESRQIFPTASGAHHLTVTARDFAGNATSTSFDWSVE